MKINVQVDCTPEEARQFLGLPDVRAFQDEMMQIMRDKTLENMKMMEPEAAMQYWGPMMNQGMSQGMDWFKQILTATAQGVSSGATPAKKTK